MLNEEQFFDVLEGKIAPPAKKEYKRDGVVIFFPEKDALAESRKASIEKYAVERKRLKNMWLTEDSTINEDRRRGDEFK